VCVVTARLIGVRWSVPVSCALESACSDTCTNTSTNTYTFVYRHSHIHIHRSRPIHRKRCKDTHLLQANNTVSKRFQSLEHHSTCHWVGWRHGEVPIAVQSCLQHRHFSWAHTSGDAMREIQSPVAAAAQLWVQCECATGAAGGSNSKDRNFHELGTMILRSS
jgi:hypothetical protein